MVNPISQNSITYSPPSAGVVSERIKVFSEPWVSENNAVGVNSEYVGFFEPRVSENNTTEMVSRRIGVLSRPREVHGYYACLYVGDRVVLWEKTHDLGIPYRAFGITFEATQKTWDRPGLHYLISGYIYRNADDEGVYVCRAIGKVSDHKPEKLLMLEAI